MKHSIHERRSHCVITVLCLSALCLLILASCGTKNVSIERSDLVGDWYTTEDYPYEVLSFFEDGTYSCSVFAPGNYGIYNKTGNITLVDSAGNIVRLIPEHDDSGWILLAQGLTPTYHFTKNQRDASSENSAPSAIAVSSSATEDLLRQKVLNVLSASAWSSEEGSVVAFSHDYVASDMGLKGEYTITDVSSDGNAAKATVLYQENTGTIMLTPVYYGNREEYISAHGVSPAPDIYILDFNIPGIISFHGSPLP